MLLFIIRRVAWIIPTLFAALFLVFLLIQIMPGDPVMAQLGPRATAEARQVIVEKLHLDEPIYVRFGYYIWHALHGDLGRSILDGRDVFSKVMTYLPNTIVLAVTSIGLAAFIGAILGTTSATFKDSFYDNIVIYFSLVLMSLPDYIWGILLLILFGLKLKLFPILGVGNTFVEQMHHLALPALALASGWIGYFTRIMRTSTLEVLNSPYIKIEKSFGIPDRVIWAKYALRNAISPLVATCGIGMGWALGGAVFMEVIFTRPGIGRLLAQSVRTQDLPVLQGTILVTAILYLLTNLIADLSHSFIDPRLRHH
jgi:peptide/nickel transport system permease protein